MRIARNDWIAEARDAATVLGRSVSFAADIVRIGDARLAGANVAHGEAALNQKKMAFGTTLPERPKIER